MNCPICGSVNAPNSPFCVHCGSPLVRTNENVANVQQTQPQAQPYAHEPMPQPNTGYPYPNAGYPQQNAAPYVQPQPHVSERYADVPTEPASYGPRQNPQQPNNAQGQHNPRQYSSLREAAEAAQSNSTPVSGAVEQPPYYPPYVPAQQPNPQTSNDKKANLSDAAQNMVQKAKRGFKSKKIIGGIFAAVALIAVICVVAFFIGNNSGFVALKTSMSPVIVDGEIRIMVNDKLLDDKIEGESVHGGSSSLDGKVIAFTNDENTLYVVNGKKVAKVAEDVITCEVSTSGKGVAYIVDNDDDGYSLVLYTVRNGKEVTVSDEVAGYTFAISPDGKSVAYYVEGDDNDELMYAKGDDSVKVTSDEVDLLGLSNDGKQIYASREDDDTDIIYAYNKKGEKTKLGKTDDYTVYFNEKHTEIMFFNDGKTYVSAKGDEGVKMSSDELHLVLAPNSATYSDRTSYTYPVSSLYGHVYLVRDDEGSNAWLINKNPDKNVKLASDVSNVMLDKTGKYLYYIHDYEDLMVLKVSNGEKASDKAIELAEDVSAYVVTPNRSKVYYVSDEELYSINGKKGGSPKRIAEDVDSYGLAMSGKNVAFYISDGDLYACNNGKSGERVLSDCEGVSNTPNGVVYAVDEDAVYASTGSKKLNKVAELDN